MLESEDYGCDNNNNNNEVVSCYNNFIASIEYDRAITAAIQSNLYDKNLKKEQEEKEKDIHKQEKSIEKKRKIIMIVDDDSDITLTFKRSLEAQNDSNSNDSIFFEVYTYNHPLLALSGFKQNFYDLLLIDINMQKMNGFDLSTKILEIDPNPKICFMSSGEINHEALREVYPAINIGCFIRKPVTIDYLVKRVKAELEQTQ